MSAARPPLLRATAQALAVAAAYCVVGRLSLYLAIPPGFATAAWPAAGIALASVLVLGNRVLPGVVLGSFLVNVSVAIETGGSDPLLGAMVAVAIGVGAALEAALGAYLVRRYIGYPTALDHERDVVAFVVLAGPVACLVSATWCNGVLLAAGAIRAGDYAFNWGTWWVGDVIGVITVAPFALIGIARPREVWRRRAVPLGLPLAATLAVAVTLYLRVSRAEQERIQTAFQQRADDTASNLERRLDHYSDALRSLGAAYTACGPVDRDRFRRLVDDELSLTLPVKALEWAPRVTAADQAAFAIWEGTSVGGRRSPGGRAEYFPVLYVEPLPGNEPVLGYDLGAEPVRAATLARARRTGQPAATPPISLVHTAPRGDGLLLVRAIFKAEGRADGDLLGYVAAVFHVSELLAPALAPLDRDGIRLALYDATDPARWSPFDIAGTDPDRVTPRRQTGLAPALGHVRVADREWIIRLTPSPVFLADARSWQAWTVLTAGLLFTGLLGAFLLVVSGRTTRIQLLVAERTRDLAASNAVLAAHERQLSQSLRDKEMLLQEIHHRVKNNMQVISSMLNLQAQTMTDPATQALFQTSQSRIQSMALVHDQLYHAGELTRVGVADYAHQLLDRLAHGYGAAQRGITVDVAVDDAVVPIDVAIPVGLILNELVSNAFKHAFGPAGGRLTIRLTRTATGLELIVRDDGVGLPAGVEPGHTDSVGLELVAMLVEQIDGALAIARSGGTEVRVTFKP